MEELVLVGTVLGLIQVLAALPWLAALDPVGFRAWWGRFLSSWRWLKVGAGTAVGLAAASFLFANYISDPDSLVLWGQIYGSVLQAQLCADLFVLALGLLLTFWPHGGAVALAAFREGVRQPMFWLLVTGALLFPLGGLLWAPFLPYFTFGEDFKMMKELGFDLIMLVATAFGVINSSMSVSEEIEGKTAVTLMSKPVSRRQFLLGKYFGTLLASLAMTLLLGWFFMWVVYFKPRWDPWNSFGNPLEKVPDPEWVVNLVATLPFGESAGALIKGILIWADQLALIGLGLVLGFGQLMVLLAVATALATRLPMIVNLVVCLVIFFLGHLAPILSAVSQNRYELVKFTADVFNLLLPGLELFDMGPAVVRDNPVPIGDFALYVGSVTLYSVLYTAIALLFGLILFEDRDLA